MEKPDICKGCGYKFSYEGENRSPCPACGCKSRIISASVQDGICLSDSVGWISRREFYEKNQTLFIMIVAITIISPFIGLVLAGIPGIVVGLLLGAVSYILGPHATTKVREIEAGRKR